MNKCTLIVQILQCNSVKTLNNGNTIIKLHVRFLKRKKLTFIHLILWKKQSLEIFQSLKRFDYVIIEGQLNKNAKIIKHTINRQQDIIFNTLRIFKYKSILKNKAVDLFIK